MRGFTQITLAVVIALAATGLTGCGDEVDALHRSLPSSMRSDVTKWLEVTDVEMSETGTVTVHGTRLEASSEATDVVTLGMSPRGRRVWGLEQTELAETDEISITYAFGFQYSKSEPEPMDGHYVLVLSSAEGEQCVFIDFNAGEWVAD